MFGVYMVLIAGMFIAFMTLLAEIYWHKKRIKESILNKLVIRLVTLLCFCFAVDVEREN